MSNQVEPHKSSIGDMQANIIALLCYLASSALAIIPVIKYVAWLAPLVIFFLEKESRFVKFHAMQAFVLNAIGAALGLLVSVIIGGIFTVSAYNPYTAYAAFGIAGFVGILTTAISIIVLVFAVTAMIKAYKYTEYRIPLIGGIAAKLVEKVK